MAVDAAENMAEEALPTGALVGGKYRVVGGQCRSQGELRCAAVHEGTGRRVQLRVLADASDEQHSARMLRAARASGSTPHAHVLGVIDSGLDAAGRLYVVYEHFDGTNARAHVNASGALSLADAADVVQQLARALGSLHRRGIVHRAVRPEHVLLAATPHGMRAKLSGFELAVVPPRFLDAPPLPRGFSRFAAPETRRDASEAGAGADLFALGVMLRFLATANDAESSSLPANAERIVERATSAEPEARFAHADQLAAALALLLPTDARSSSVTPSDALVADVRYFQKLSLQESGVFEGLPDVEGLWYRTALCLIEAVYARAGREGWAQLVAEVPLIEALLPRPNTAARAPDARVSTQLMTAFLEAADGLLRAPNDVPMAALPGLGAAVSQRGLRRIFPAYPAQLTVSAWLDSLPALYAALFARGQAEVSDRTEHEARLTVRDQGAPSLALTAVFAGLLRAELARFSAAAAVRVVTSAVLGDATDSFDIAF